MSRAPVFVFPGQGSQKVGMAGAFMDDRSDLVKRYFSRAEEICGVNLLELCQEGPEDQLALTANAQPALLTLSYVGYRLLTERTGVYPSTVVGHSLGEYTALLVAGCLSFEDAVRVVRRRGELMQRSVPAGAGTMIALIGLSPEQVREMVAGFSSRGRVEIANLNSREQTVLSLEIAMKEMVLEEARRLGVKRSVELKVSAPFHSSFMAEAAGELASLLRTVTLQGLRYRYISNVDGCEADEPEQIVELLVRQMYSPVLWKSIMDRLISEECREFYEIGPGRVLSRLIKREYPQSVVHSIDSVQAIERYVEGRGEHDHG